MCGIAGFVSPPGRFDGHALTALAERACAALRHRGPDDEGVWIDEAAGVALAHRRLSILDLSPEGHQPMVAADGQSVLTYNGEIYNFRELRRELEDEDISFRGQSDTEVMLAGIGHWGLDETLRRCNGMFAFALWDRARRQLHLARDRFGQKPLYFGWLGDSFAFASELKALRHHPDFTGSVDRGALALLLRYGYIPAPFSIHDGIEKLQPGAVLTVPFGSGAERTPTPARPFWSPVEAAQRGIATPLDGSADDMIAELDELLRDAVRLCTVSDVPIGAFLSGGIDSSTVVALMQAQSNRPVKTFSIGFHEGGYNEADHAAKVAAHLGTDHTELYVTAADAQAVIPKLSTLYDEPFADPSQIPTYLVSKLARASVTVSLSGDGGDEIFGGYNRYIWGRNLERATILPRPLRRLAALAIKAVPVEGWNGILSVAAPLLPSRLRHGQAGDKLHKLAEVIDAASKEEMYQRLISHWNNPGAVVQDGGEPGILLNDASRWPSAGGFTEQMMLLDVLGYLPDDILVKLDRASMAVSLEGRVPLLDHRIMEFAWRLPASMKIRDGRGKWLLRQVLARYVPESLIDRPKMGFGVPIDRWLRGDLRDWAEELLGERRLSESGYFDVQTVRRIWQEHLSGRRNWQYRLWPLLMFEAWRNQQG